ncbi:hypothetical protein F2Q68_00015150 [Brassica cretica]|uniref:Uncharacterized protein n=1 Tax=Brassica cretica TaxID=69181 RepID=A0A8S9HID4_BRACR|nr:hypothetical protein F2Q68_00015150 [Brassica cretica]
MYGYSRIQTNKNSRSTFVYYDYLSSDLGPQLSLVGPEKVSIDSNDRMSINTPFSPSIDTTNELSIDVPSSSVTNGELGFKSVGTQSGSCALRRRSTPHGLFRSIVAFSHRSIVVEGHLCNVADQRLDDQRAVIPNLDVDANAADAQARPSLAGAQSLRSDRATCVSDRAWLELGRYVATELGLCVVRWPYLSLFVADLDMFLLPPDNRDGESSQQVRAGAELPSSSALADAPGHGTEGVTPRDTGNLAGSVIPDASALPAGSSTTLILIEDKERAADSMPPPPARKEIVLVLRAPSVVPVAQPNFLLVSQFMSLIDGMISECCSETSRLAGELLELQGRWSETEAMLTAVKDSHSVKVSKLEVAIGELERDLEKTVSSLLKEKKSRKAKSSEVHRLQRQIEGDAGLASRGIREAKDALRSEFQARLAMISAFLGSIECIRNRDLALATIESGMAMVQSFQSETPPNLEA